MNKKLTLSIDSSLIAKGKLYAQKLLLSHFVIVNGKLAFGFEYS